VSKPFLRLRVPLGFLFAACYLFVARPASWQAFGVCVLFVSVGCLIRSWAAGYLLKGKRVAVGGPYAFVRNPLYVGSFFIGAGFCAALWRRPLPWSSVSIGMVFLVSFGFIYSAKTLAEEKELASALGEPYVHYAGQVPAFLPFHGRVSGLGPQRFSWEIYRRNREYECLLGSAALLIYLYWRSTHGL